MAVTPSVSVSSWHILMCKEKMLPDTQVASQEEKEKNYAMEILPK
jgi:hypothetical protein